MAFEPHQLALKAAQRLLMYLPANTVWSLCATDDDTAESPGVFNIFVETEQQRIRMRNMLGFGKPNDEGDSHESHKFQDTLLVSIIEPEEESHESA